MKTNVALEFIFFFEKGGEKESYGELEK